MIKDYQNKEVLAEMKRQVNAAAKISDREARITFVLIHMISEYHILAEQCTKPDGENNLFRFISWCLSRFAEELETPSNEEFKNPIELYKKDSDINLLELIRFRTPAKNAVEKGLDESFEWPDNVPYEEWEEDILQTAYATLFGLYFFNTSAERTRLREADGPLPWKKKPKRMYVSDEECAKGEEHVAELRRNFVDVVEKLATGDTLRFCREKERPSVCS